MVLAPLRRLVPGVGESVHLRFARWWLGLKPFLGHLIRFWWPLDVPPPAFSPPSRPRPLIWCDVIAAYLRLGSDLALLSLPAYLRLA